MAGTVWDKDIKNAVFIGPSGVGKTHLGEALCVKAIERGIPATSITCYELGYVFPPSENANDIFQIVSGGPRSPQR